MREVLIYEAVYIFRVLYYKAHKVYIKNMNLETNDKILVYYDVYYYFL